MLLSECGKAGVSIQCNTTIKGIQKNGTVFTIETENKDLQSTSLVIATGGLSIPKMGATAFGLKIAEQFGLNIISPRAGLVPFTLHQHDKEHYQKLSGISVDAIVTAENGQSFREAVLFTHRGLSGPASLQISSYWQPGQFIEINLLPDIDLEEYLNHGAIDHPKQSLKNFLSGLLPKRLIESRMEDEGISDINLNQVASNDKQRIVACLKHWKLKPNGTEGYRTAEVTVGGVDTNNISSKTMQAINVAGLYFIGEVLDVTGHLGGYNFQWAWASGYVAGLSVE